MILLFNIFWFLVAIFILVSVHEWGHFIVARLCGVKVLRFSIGFGKPLFGWADKKGTNFALASIPLGGYVKMLDEREGPVKEEDHPYEFTRKNVWQRIAIVSAGPGINFVAAVFFFFLVALQGEYRLTPIVGSVVPNSIAAEASLSPGQEIIAVDGNPTPSRQDFIMALMRRLGESGSITFATRYPDDKEQLVYHSEAIINDWLKGAVNPDPITSIGITFKQIPPTLGDVIEGGPADEAGLQADDEILQADDSEIRTWPDFVSYVRARPELPIVVLVHRGGQEHRIKVVPDTVEDDETGETIGKIFVYGTTPDYYLRIREYTFNEAWHKGVTETVDLSLFVLDSIKKLLTGQISAKNVNGPVTIAQVAGATASHGWVDFVNFLAFLSITLGVMNLLPIPVLDGGHLFFYGIEVVKGRPVSEKTQQFGYSVGFIVIICLMILGLYNDIANLFT